MTQQSSIIISVHGSYDGGRTLGCQWNTLACPNLPACLDGRQRTLPDGE